MGLEAIDGAGVVTVTVKGEAVIAAEPDQAILWITLSTFGESPGQVLDDVARRSEALSVLLDELEVIEAHRSTAGVSVQEEFDPPKRGGRGLSHRATARIGVRLADPEVTGVPYRERARSCAPASTVRTGTSRANPVRYEVIKQAVIDARRKAQACTEGADAKLGVLIRLSEPDTMARRPGIARRAARPPAQEMPIETEQPDVHALIEATFALEVEASGLSVPTP